eukprot:5395753-Lingulodinium_polyedra.AAC.1
MAAARAKREHRAPAHRSEPARAPAPRQPTRKAAKALTALRADQQRSRRRHAAAWPSRRRRPCTQLPSRAAPRTGSDDGGAHGRPR